MDKRQIEQAHKGHWQQIERIYQGMIGRYRGKPEWMAWAKAWRLEMLRRVCQKTRERSERLECQ